MKRIALKGATLCIDLSIVLSAFFVSFSTAFAMGTGGGPAGEGGGFGAFIPLILLAFIVFFTVKAINKFRKRGRLPEPPGFADQRPSGHDGVDTQTQYKDGYSVAKQIIAYGTFVKTIGVLLGIGIIIGSIFLARSQGGGAAIIGGIAIGLVVGVILYSIGIFISAIGQLLLASFDTAVNTSVLKETGNAFRRQSTSQETGDASSKTDAEIE